MRHGAGGRVDRAGPPPAGPQRPFRFPAFERRPIAPGLEALVAPLGRVPLVHLQLIAPGGAQHDPPGAAGLATLTASLLDHGTARRSAPEIAAHVEGLGGYLSAGADWDAAYLSLAVLSDHLRRGLELLAEVALSPSFPEAEVDRLRRQRLADLLRRRDQPAALADEQIGRLLYAGTVYGNPLLGTEESIGEIGRDAVDAFYRLNLATEGAWLVAVGDLDPTTLAAEAAETFAGWQATPAPVPPEIKPVPGERRIAVVDRPRAAQTELRVAKVGISRGHPDYLGLVVLNSLLGGKFTSRINLNLRERLGFTYGAHSRLARRRGPGPFVVATAVATPNAAAAVREILHELERLRQEPVSAAELEDTQNYLLGVFPYTVQNLEGLANRLEELAVFGLPEDYFHRYAERIRAVDRETLLALARRHLDPERAAIVAVGPAGELEPQLEPFGPRVSEGSAAAI